MASRVIEVVSGMDLKMSPIRLIAVELRHGGERRDVVLDFDRRGAVIEFPNSDGSRDVEYGYRAHLRSDYVAGAHEFAAAPRTTDATVLIIDPRECYRQVQLHAAAMFDAARYRAAAVDFTVGSQDPDMVTVHLNDDVRDAQYLTLRPAGESPGIKVRIRYVTRSGNVIDGEWQPFDGTTVLVSNPVMDAVGVTQ